jgi:hypothetical protein
MKEEGPIQDHIRFDSINHQTGQAKITYGKEDGPYPVRFREFAITMTFFELTEKGELDPVITTVLDEYYTETTKFIAVRSLHVGSAFKRVLALQKHGTCIPGK